MSADSLNWSWWATMIEDADEKPSCYEINEPTREAVITAARRAHGATAWLAVVEATQDGEFNARPFNEADDCDLLEAALDKFCYDNGDRWGEGDGAPTGLLAPGLAKSLNDTFETFMRENHETLMEGAWTFTEERNFEVVPPEEPADA